MILSGNLLSWLIFKSLCIYLIKYSSNGTLQWEGLYADLDLWGEKGDNAGEDVCITSDGGYLVANDVGGFGFTKISSGGK